MVYAIHIRQQWSKTRIQSSLYFSLGPLNSSGTTIFVVKCIHGWHVYSYLGWYYQSFKSWTFLEQKHYKKKVEGYVGYLAYAIKINNRHTVISYRRILIRINRYSLWWWITVTYHKRYFLIILLVMMFYYLLVIYNLHKIVTKKRFWGIYHCMICLKIKKIYKHAILYDYVNIMFILGVLFKCYCVTFYCVLLTFITHSYTRILIYTISNIIIQFPIGVYK